MKTVGSFEAKTHFAALLKEVENGETIVVTRNGKPVARVVPADDSAAMTREQAMQRILSNRVRIGIPLRDLIDEGKRY